MKTKLTLSPQDVQQIVKDYISTRFKVIGEIKFEVSKELRGSQMDEHYETVFKGATCEVDSFVKVVNNLR